MLTQRRTWIRGLSLFDPSVDVIPGPAIPGDDSLHACSWFESRSDRGRYARYSLHVAEDAPPRSGDDHTLAVVREFRRVPLCASALALALFAARPGRAAALVATLAHFAERALSTYQPAYLLLARSLETPGLAVLLTGVDHRTALEAATPSPFSLDALMPEALPLLMGPPDLYRYRHSSEAVLPGTAPLVSARAV